MGRRKSLGARGVAFPGGVDEQAKVLVVERVVWAFFGVDGGVEDFEGFEGAGALSPAG